MPSRHIRHHSQWDPRDSNPHPAGQEPRMLPLAPESHGPANKKRPGVAVTPGLCGKVAQKERVSLAQAIDLERMGQITGPNRFGEPKPTENRLTGSHHGLECTQLFSPPSPRRGRTEPGSLEIGFFFRAYPKSMLTYDFRLKTCAESAGLKDETRRSGRIVDKAPCLLADISVELWCGVEHR